MQLNLYSQLKVNTFLNEIQHLITIKKKTQKKFDYETASLQNDMTKM